MDVFMQAARALCRAGQWQLALDVAHELPASPERSELIAEINVDRDFWTGWNRAPALLAELPSGWDADMLRVRADHTDQLRTLIDGGTAAGAPDIIRRAARLIDEAPDAEREAEARLYHALALDALTGDADAAQPDYRRVTDIGSGYLAGFAWRHLGAYARAAGDDEAADAMARRALRLRQEVGHLTGALAQLLLVGELTPGELVHDWGAALGAGFLVDMADAAAQQ